MLFPIGSGIRSTWTTRRHGGRMRPFPLYRAIVAQIDGAPLTGGHACSANGLIHFSAQDPAIEEQSWRFALELFRHGDGFEQRRGLIYRFLILQRWDRIGHDSRPRLDVNLPGFEQRSAQHDTRIHVAIVSNVT